MDRRNPLKDDRMVAFKGFFSMPFATLFYDGHFIDQVFGTCVLVYNK